MILKDFMPSLSLRRYVRCYRIVEFKFDRQLPLAVKFYPPKPENILHFFLRERFAIEGNNGALDFQSPACFVGQRTQVFRQINEPDFLNFQIVFHPTALFRLSGIPAVEFTNRFVTASEVFSREISFTYEKLRCASNYDDLLKIGESFVYDLVKKARREADGIDSVVDVMLKNQQVTVSEYADQANISPKQFKRIFFERTGVNPKIFFRIIRFNKAFNLRNRYSQLDWLQIALDSGYHDYQHLVRDYKEFTGYTPAEFHVLEKRSPEQILGLAEEVYKSRCQL